MNELREILTAWRSLTGASRDSVLATVVHVTGSAYRRPGARMLIVPDGRRIGSVSGGCLEGEVAKKAWWFTGSRTPVLRVYDTSSDEEAAWEFGLGCNGVVEILLERVDTPAAAQMLAFLDTHQTKRAPAVVATVLRGVTLNVGDRLLVDSGGVQGGSLAGTVAGSQILPHARTALAEKSSRVVSMGDIDVFVEWIGPTLPLVVFGAGHDAIPLVAVAGQLGWDISVADGRPAYACSTRFPQAERVIVMRSGDLLRDISIGRDSAVLLMTHNYPLDLQLLPQILPFEPRYVGLLGPHARASRLFSDLKMQRPQNVHAPVGLDIGCDTPAAVALSIVAEIQAVVSGRPAVKLSNRAGAIHEPAREIAPEPRTRLFGAVRPEYCETMAGANV